MAHIKPVEDASQDFTADLAIEVISFRLPRSLKQALDKCAADDARPSSMKLRLILADWLRSAGYLK